MGSGGGVLGMGLTNPLKQENWGSASLNCKAWLRRLGSCSTSSDVRAHPHKQGQRLLRWKVTWKHRGRGRGKGRADEQEGQKGNKG